MRVLRVAQKSYPGVKGGAPYHVHAMSRDQAAMGHDVTVATVRHDADLPAVESRDGYVIRRFDPTASLLGNDVSAGLAGYLVDADGFDVVHAHSHLYFATNLAAAIGARTDAPLAITNHGLFSQNAPERLFEAYLRSIGRWTLNAADVVFCYCAADARRLRSYGVSADVAVVPNGVDGDRFSPNGRSSPLIDAEGPAILFVGRLVPGKRPDLAVEIVRRVRREVGDATLYVCGDGRMRDELVRRTRRSNGAVVLLGHVPYDAMPAVYRSADVLVLPSRTEGVPRSVLEAQATNVPVVASDLPGLRSARTTADRLVSSDDPSAFAAEIVDVLEGDDRTSEDGSAVDRSWDRTVARTTEILARLAGEPRSP